MMNNNRIVLISLFLVFSVLLCSCGNGAEEISLVKPKLDQSLGVVPSLEDAEVIFNVKDDVFGKTLTIYKKVNDKKDLLEKVKKQLGFENEIGISYGGSYKQFENEEKVILKVYDTGSFMIDFKKPGSGITISEEQMEEMAEQKLAEFNISLEGFERSGKQEMIDEYGEYKTLERVVLYYKKKVDGYGIVGSSKITVGFAEDEIYSVGMIYSGREKAFDIEAKSREYVEANFVEDMLDINVIDYTVIGSGIKQIEVTGAEIVYLDVHYDQEQPHIQPLYRFSGKLIAEDGTESDFESLMSAVPDEYFAED